MNAVDEIQAAIGRLTALKAASLMMPDFYKGLSTIAEWRESCVLIETLHRTIDAQLAILSHVAAHYSGDLGISTNRHVVALARAINGGTN